MTFKKEILLSVIGGLVLGMIIMFLITKTQKVGAAKDTISLAMPAIEGLDDNHLVKIENFGVTVEDFTNTYEQVLATLPPAQLAQITNNEAAARAEILENMINQSVVMRTAIEEGFLEDEENLTLLNNALRQALFQLYIAQNAPQDPNAFAPSQPEIDQAYSQFGQQLRAQGLNARQIEEYLSGQIAQQKQQRWAFDFIQKIREGYRIERNESLMSNMQISSAATGVLPTATQP